MRQPCLSSSSCRSTSRMGAYPRRAGAPSCGWPSSSPWGFASSSGRCSQASWARLRAWDSLSDLVLAGLPVAVGIAILRYRLYEIDRIINRTLVYGALTAILAGVYFGGVTATQAILQTLTGQEELPQLAIVASTLVIAALFTPLRRR